jgi:hypothetical protein
MFWRSFAIVVALALGLAASAAIAQDERKNLQSLWDEATTGVHTIVEYDDYTMVDRGNAYYYFTKEGHYAHPGVIRRALVEANGRFFIDTQGWSFAPEGGQPGFQRWLEEAKELNRKILEAIEQERE